MSTKVFKTTENKRAACARARAKRDADPVKAQANKDYMKAYRQNNREKLNAQSSSRYHNDPLKRFKYRLRRLGIPAEDWLLEYLMSHNGLCDICGNPGDGRWKELAIDHCHDSNKFRGMLCSDCNHAIGKLKDDPELIRRVADYVEHYK